MQGVVGGWSDTALTAKGRNQAERAGRRLCDLWGDIPPQINFYCSDLSRASETAAIIGDIISKRPVAVEALRELNNGLAANKTKAEAEALQRPMTYPILDWVLIPKRKAGRCCTLG